MVIGIVGAEAAKFTLTGERQARELIRACLSGCTLVVSGECHLGGIDLWAMGEAHDLGIPSRGFPLATYSWETGYKPCNIQIAKAADYVVCITVSRLPANYIGMRFSECYHCHTTDHVKSGGCWTVNYARRLEKPADVFTVVQ